MKKEIKHDILILIFYYKIVCYFSPKIEIYILPTSKKIDCKIDPQKIKKLNELLKSNNSIQTLNLWGKIKQKQKNKKK